MGPLLGPSLGPISPFPLAALKLDEIDQNALLPNQKTVQSDSFAPFFVRQYHNTHFSQISNETPPLPIFITFFCYNRHKKVAYKFYY